MSAALEDARAAIALEEQARQANGADDQAIYRLKKAVMLAPDLATCEALLRGEDVPISRLDPAWARRYGLL